MAKTFTLPEVAAKIGAPTWAVRRLFERGILPEPPRVGIWRTFTDEDLPRIREALLSAGYLKNTGEATAHA